jgi:hypothetical protein
MDLQIKEHIAKIQKEREDEMAEAIIDHNYLSWEEVRSIVHRNILLLQKHPELKQRILDGLDEGERLLNSDHDAFTQAKYLVIKDAIIADLEVLNNNKKLKKAS